MSLFQFVKTFDAYQYETSCILAIIILQGQQLESIGKIQRLAPRTSPALLVEACV